MTYQNYDKEIDYAEQITKMMAGNAPAYEVEDMLNRRVNKALDNEELRQYAYDDFYKTARAYIDRKQQMEQSAKSELQPPVNQDASAMKQPSGNGKAEEYQGTTYTDPYADKREALMEQIAGREFSYSPQKDPVYQSYLAQYSQSSDRASRNALAEAAALTGGQASTAAIAAATQAADYYTSKAGAVLPELYQLAYQMYAGENQTLLNQLDILTGLSSQSYQQWSAQEQEQYTRWKDAQDTAYSRQQAAEKLAYERQQAAEKTAYERYLDTMQRAQADSQTAAAEREAIAKAAQAEREAAAEQAQNTAKNQQQAEKQAYDRAMAFLNQGVMPTEQMLAAANIPKAQAEALRAAALRKLAS